jgi:hypothetical protein
MANSCRRAKIVRRRSSVLDAVKMISSTYSKRYIVSELRRKMNNEVSDLASMNPSVVR